MAQSQDEAFFENRIRPVLANHCHTCHTDLQSGGLRLDSREAMLKGGNSGPAVIPGDPDSSLLIQAVHHTHERLKMPPAGQLPQAQIADLVEWVKAGAVWGGDLPEVSRTPDYVITPEQKAFWAFQPVKEQPVPEVKHKDWTVTPIDQFIVAELEERNLAQVAEADKRTLIRRATFDLIGLPPRPEEVESFLADDSADAFSKVVDRLLASPHYGERWGRHWLDLVRYSDSAGDSADYPIPQIYLYRNYVIDAFNEDKPYDQFIREQIAGDLLTGRTAEERWEQVIATGYLAVARRFSVRPERMMHLTIGDSIDNLGKTFLGLTVACARCHDHKYDPISNKDYYALYGIFDSTRYPFAGSENIQNQMDLVTRLPEPQVDEILKPFRENLAPLQEKIEQLEKERDALQKNEKAEDGRSLDQIRAELRELQQQRKALLAAKPPLEMAFAVVESEDPHNARIHLRGEPNKLGEEVPRRFLRILGGQHLPAWERGSGRLELAQWLVDRENPLTARVMVNRIWQYHFREGIVRSPSNFGSRGELPTHPELLDYLASKFVESGWSIKKMHRLIMNSRTYQLSSQAKAANAVIDPDNRFFWKFKRHRLDAESIRDSILFISGRLKTGQAEDHPFPHHSIWNFTQHRPYFDVYETEHRSVYMMTQRIQKHPYLSTFDGADPNLTTPQRAVTTTPIQALFMMNSDFLHEQARHFTARLIAEVPESCRIDQAHRLALARPATPEEKQKAEEYLHQVRGLLEKTEVPASEQPREALASYLRALLSSNEFLYVD